MTADIQIAWALINYGPIFSPVYDTHLRAIACASRRLHVEQLGGFSAVGATDRMYTHSAENQAVKDFLYQKESTHLFMTESDMLLPDNTIEKLLAVDKDIVSGLYFLRKGDGQPCLYKKPFSIQGKEYAHTPVRLFPENRPFKLNGVCGLGCVLIKREVFEGLEYPWFDLSATGYGSDMYFYTHVRKAGFEVWVDPSVACAQIEYTLWGIRDYHERIKEDPQFASSGAIIGLENFDGEGL